MNSTWIRGAGLGVWVVAAAAGCGGSSTPTSPSGGGGGGTPTSGATITIGSNGAVSPVQVTINVGQSVTFVNSDGKAHTMDSDPHPSHTDCPAINAVGALAAGQTKASDALTTARTCGYHDHNDAGNANLKGTIVIR